MPDYPKVFIAVPTGYTKEYALLYMLAAIKNIDYPPEQLSINFAVTNRRNRESEPYFIRVKSLLAAAGFKSATSTLYVSPSDDEINRWGPYFAVISNVHRLRLMFLEGDADYFWLLGGDNPPTRNLLKNLLKMNVDVASPRINQRPKRSVEQKPIPIFWSYYWTMKDIEGFDPRIKEQLRKSWQHIAFLRYPNKKSERRQWIHRTVAFGSGCSLVRRIVLEYAGYSLGGSSLYGHSITVGYHSEDLNFSQYVNALGFKTAINLRLHCPHLDPEGISF